MNLKFDKETAYLVGGVLAVLIIGTVIGRILKAFFKGKDWMSLHNGHHKLKVIKLCKVGGALARPEFRRESEPGRVV